ncbi:nuclear transport factor 2 family protein [Phormidesmis sp. 146-12]
MSNSAALTQTELQEFAEAWYQKLDVHEPLENYLPLLAEDVEMVFPEATVRGFAGFTGWYERVVSIFFDEVHTVKDVKTISTSEDATDVKVVVKWEASVWNAPEPYSKRIVLDAYQTWTVKRSTLGTPVVATYIVDELKYYEGSATL